MSTSWRAERALFGREAADRAVVVVSLWGLKVHDLLGIKHTSRLWNK